MEKYSDFLLIISALLPVDNSVTLINTIYNTREPVDNFVHIRKTYGFAGADGKHGKRYAFTTLTTAPWITLKP